MTTLLIAGAVVFGVLEIREYRQRSLDRQIAQRGKNCS